MMCFSFVWVPSLQSHWNTANEWAGDIRWIEGEIRTFVNPLAYANERQSVLIVTRSGLRVIMTMRVEGLSYGDTVRVFGLVEHPEGPRNPGGFDQASWAAGLGVMLTGNALGTPEVLTNKPLRLDSKLLKVAWRFRIRMERSLFQRLPAAEASTLCALLLGDRSMLDDGIEQDFRAIGLSHLLVVSGTHLSMIIMPMQWVIGSAGAGKMRKVALHLGLSVFVGMATGCHPSVLRAILMSSFVLVGRLAKRTPDGPSHLAACVAMLLFSAPWLVRNLGFLVSVSATAGILLIGKPWIEERRNASTRTGRSVPLRIRSAAVLSLSAQAAAWPVIVMRNAVVPLLSLPCNLTLVPIFTVLLPATLLLGIAGIWAECAMLSGFVVRMIRMVTSMAEFAAGQSFAQLLIPFWNGLSSASILMFLGRIAIRRVYWRRAVAWMACVAAVVFLFQWTVYEVRRPDLLVVFADVGQGDGTLLRTKSGFTVVVDAGTESAGARVILPILGSFGIAKPDICIATHGHDDHAAGFFPLLSASGTGVLGLPVDSSHLPQPEDAPDLCPELARKARETGADVIKLRQGDHLETSGGIRIDILNPTPDTVGENERSIVMHITYGAFSMLLMGDAGQESEQRMLESGLLPDVDVLRVGHHGSSGSTSPAFLEQVRPEISVISVGYNRYGHPAAEVLERLADAGSEIYRTDRTGALILQLRKNRMQIQPYAGGRFH